MKWNRAFRAAVLERTRFRVELHAPDTFELHHIPGAQLAKLGYPCARISPEPRHPPADRILFQQGCRQDHSGFIIGKAALFLGCDRLDLDRDMIGWIFREPAVVDAPLQYRPHRCQFRVLDRLRPQSRLNHRAFPGDQVFARDLAGIIVAQKRLELAEHPVPSVKRLWSGFALGGPPLGELGERHRQTRVGHYRRVALPHPSSPPGPRADAKLALCVARQRQAGPLDRKTKRLGENQFALLVDHQSTRRKTILGAGPAPVLHVAELCGVGIVLRQKIGRQRARESRRGPP